MMKEGGGGVSRIVYIIHGFCEENNYNFVKYSCFSFIYNSKTLHHVQLFNSFHLIYGAIFHVQ